MATQRQWLTVFELTPPIEITNYPSSEFLPNRRHPKKPPRVVRAAGVALPDAENRK
jgi:hypothetical protein